jgi:hypothetical protein
MWIDKEVTVNKKKINAKVNLGLDQSEVELPFFDGWDNLGVMKIDKDKYIISSAKNVGARDEVINMIIKKEKNDDNKFVESREDS